MLPTLLRLAFVLRFILLLGWMLPFLMRLVWTLPCRYTAAMVDTALLLQLLRTPFYTAVRVGAASFFWLLWTLVWTLTLYTAVSVYAAYKQRFGWVLPLLML